MARQIKTLIILVFALSLNCSANAGIDDYFYDNIENAIGDKLAIYYAQQYGVYQDKEANERVTRIFNELNRYSKNKRARGIFINRQGGINAFAVIGYTSVYYDTLFLTDDQLAFIIGHEIGHLEKRHMTKSIAASYGFAALSNAINQKDSSYWDKYLT